MGGIYWWLVVPSQRAINAENVFIWWRHHALTFVCSVLLNVFASYLKDKSDCSAQYTLVKCSRKAIINSFHDDVIKLPHFPRYWPFVRGIHRSPVTRSFDAYFDLRPIKRLSKQSRSWWFEAPSRPLWRHRNVEQIFLNIKCAYWHKMRKEALCHVTMKFVYLARNVKLPCLTLSLFPH